MPEPTSQEAISKISSVISEKVFKEHGAHIVKFINENPTGVEHPYEAALRLGLTKLLTELIGD